MPNTKSAKKMFRVAERRRRYNKPVKSLVRTNLRKAIQLIAAKDLDKAQEATRLASSTLDKAAPKDVIHRNNAARRKSRLMRKLNLALAAS